jgi:2-polyprenyl-6-methoxyphenol hydroxylase-like FAD-dependent oxidoreductase
MQQTLAADLIIDASGRGSRSATWLDKWGFGRPKEISLKVNVGYATRIFERRPGDLFNSTGAAISGTPPASTRGAAVLAAEGNRWVVTLVGAMSDYPPTSEAEWTRFAASLPTPAVHELVNSARPLSEIWSYRFPANQRRFYERMKHFPSGYLVIGDALCSFNPIYGQGMSVAALEAKALGDCLAAGPEKLWPRFYTLARRIVDIAWRIATAEDLRFPQVAGRRSAAFHAMSRYMERLHAIASEDPVVCRKFFDVLNLLAPPSSLMSLPVALRVLLRSMPNGAGSPWGRDQQSWTPALQLR